MAERERVIEVRNLKTAFGRTVIHEDLDLDVYRGEILGIVGASGGGKSVLLNTMLGLQRPVSGSVVVDGQDIFDSPDRQWLASNMGVMFQNGALFSSLTLQENVEAPFLEHTEIRGEFLSRLAQMKISLVGLANDAAYKRPAELSGGMRKRAGVARALALDPKLLFLDEPTAGLDPLAAAEFDDLIVSLRDALELTVVMVTHDLDSLFQISDRVAVLADKRIVASDAVEKLRDSEDEWTRSYFQSRRARRFNSGGD
ncbi:MULTISPECIES: ABC transporter ATP-binding protein [Alphaproteobacteria]|jgi:phospholipid/cholesterol/gamma-HCH transport system ATP-binding protein|uniref:ATP-binding cassette domain-containing protein n=2 Tax=Sphingobium yanoikuyae TaxID=13690 RepID=A0A3G2UL70_SPHYA|nr:ATP-binding cassette domain-containing protein [Sphingobium yanoikuyae]AYO75713.1 ATP-binding cassette domain-containing protein [Sphingobium yanoikuyae]